MTYFAACPSINSHFDLHNWPSMASFTMSHIKAAKVLKLQLTCLATCTHTRKHLHAGTHAHRCLNTQIIILFSYPHKLAGTSKVVFPGMWTRTHITPHALVGIIALTRPNCLPFICMSMATHILPDSPFDKEGSFPQQRKWSPVDIVWLDFCLFKVSGSLQEFIWSVAENETTTLFPRLIILIPLSFLLSFSLSRSLSANCVISRN